ASELLGVPLMLACGPLAVAQQDRVLRLRAGDIGHALRMAAEAPESIGSSRQTSMDTTQARCVVDRLPVRPPAPPAVLGAEQVPEQLVAHDEERIDPDLATI